MTLSMIHQTMQRLHYPRSPHGSLWAQCSLRRAAPRRRFLAPYGCHTTLSPWPRSAAPAGTHSLQKVFSYVMADTVARGTLTRGDQRHLRLGRWRAEPPPLSMTHFRLAIRLLFIHQSLRRAYHCTIGALFIRGDAALLTLFFLAPYDQAVQQNKVQNR